MLFRVQKDKDNPYVMINKTFFNDIRLSAKAKGILGYILTLPDDWKIYLRELTTHFKDGKDSISSGVNELIDNGYVKRITLRDKKGKFKGYIYDVFEVSTEKGKSVFGESVSGKSENGEPATTNKLNKLNNNKQNNTHTDLKTLCAEIQKILGEKITQKKIKELISTAGIETIEHYMNTWDKYRPFAKQGQSAYFIYCIQHQIPIQGIKAKPKYADFKQREYDESFYEQFIENK